MRCFSATESLEREERRAEPGSFADAFSTHELLGVGSFGRVVRAVDRVTGAEYAAKIVQKHREGVLDERIAKRIHEEVGHPL